VIGHLEAGDEAAMAPMIARISPRSLASLVRHLLPDGTKVQGRGIRKFFFAQGFLPKERMSKFCIAMRELTMIGFRSYS
jgi:hypothetical protein